MYIYINKTTQPLLGQSSFGLQRFVRYGGADWGARPGRGADSIFYDIMSTNFEGTVTRLSLTGLPG